MGNFQKYGIDYTETFAPTADYKSMRLIIAIACTMNYHLHQMDVTCAFLNGDLDEEIYIRLPEGYGGSQTEGLVLKLKKSLYGLKQAPMKWNEKITEKLVGFGFVQSCADFGVFAFQSEKEHIILGLYVDDMVIADRIWITWGGFHVCWVYWSLYTPG